MLDVAAGNPDGSVLKFALHAICESLFTATNGEYVLRRVLGLALSHPHLVPCLQPLLEFGTTSNGRFRFKSELRAVLKAAATARRSDAMCWALQFCAATATDLDADLEDLLLRSYDALAVVMLYHAGSPRIRRSITRFVRRRVLPRPQSVVEHHWLLVHYLLNERRLMPTEVSDPSLSVLRHLRVNLYG